MSREAKRCIDCEYYPDHCGTWDKEYREKYPGGINKYTEHNCPNFHPHYRRGDE